MSAYPAPAASARDKAAFLSGPMATVVDFLRIASALTVFLNHTRLWTINTIGPAPSMLAAHYAVILFFVLSGLSIGTTARRAGATLGDYALARATRVLPVACCAVAFGSVLYLLRHDASPIPLDAPWQTLNAWSVITPLLFLTEAPFGVNPVWNLPYWSLSYEVWYYALLGALAFLRGPRRILFALVIAGIAGPQIMALLPLWLMGVALAWFPAFCRVRAAGGLALLAAAALFALLCARLAMPALAWMQVHAPFPLVNSQNVVGDHLFAAAAALALAGIRPFLTPLAGAIARLAPVLRWAAGMSFTLYLFHGPVLNTMGSFGLVGLVDPLHSALAMGGVLGICALIAELCERRTPALRRWIERRLVARRSAAGRASRPFSLDSATLNA